MTEGSPIRVMVVDDHDVVRRGLQVFLLAFEDLQLIGEAANGEDAVSICERMQPDVILMDIIMPGMDGIEATQIIRQRFPHINILALTSLKDDALAEKMLQAGAVDYILKNALIDELADAIRAASLHAVP
ncbi:MAG: response regulator transcription factor [Anaerolineae bacterium]|nr:response regulator transcription factor [Anaerolineae bacterium]